MAESLWRGMADRRPRGNVWLWAPLLALLLGALALVLHALLAYHAVTGYSFDWLQWAPHRTLTPGAAALELALSTFLITFLLTAVGGAVAWSLARRGRLRGRARRGYMGEPATWSEFASSRAFGLAALLSMTVAMGAFLYGIAQEPEGIGGQDFFLIQAAAGTAVVVLAVLLLVRAIALANARGRLVAVNPRGNIIARIQLASAKNAKT
ncbi:MAG: hypothetical protein ACRDH5_13330, partial [bacterium]